MMYGYSFGFGGIFMMLFWVFIIALVVWLVLTLSRSQVRADDGQRSGLRILEERLARGEIDAEEFWGRRVAITGTKS
jgi:putative membrane protein